MKKNIVDKIREKSCRGSQIVYLNVMKKHAVRSANVNCICAIGRSMNDNKENLKPGELWNGTEVSSANINVSQSTGRNDIIDDIQQRFLRFLISHNEGTPRNLSSPSRINTVRETEEFLHSSYGSFDSD